MFASTELFHYYVILYHSRSRSGYDSSSGGESDNEYNTPVSQGNQVQNQAQNSISTNITNYGQGKHINKGRWTKEEVSSSYVIYIFSVLSSTK